MPFALDRQIVVERKDGQEDRIARILSVQRGVFKTEVQQIRRSTFTLFNRLQAGDLDAYGLDLRYLRKIGTPVWVHLITSLERTPSGCSARRRSCRSSARDRRSERISSSSCRGQTERQTA